MTGSMGIMCEKGPRDGSIGRIFCWIITNFSANDPQGFWMYLFEHKYVYFQHRTFSQVDVVLFSETGIGSMDSLPNVHQELQM